MTKTENFHDMYQILFADCQARLKKAKENYRKTMQRKKEAVLKSDEAEVTNQAQIQEALNADMEQLNNMMTELIDRAKEYDDTPLPVAIAYHICNEDRMGFTFRERQSKGNAFDFDVNTRVTQIFNKACRVEIPAMRKSNRRDRLVRAVNYQLNFHHKTFMQFMTAQEFYDARSSFLGQVGTSATFGHVNGPGISDIDLENNTVKIKMANREQCVTAPVAVAKDFGAIWSFSSGSFQWFWYKNEDAHK